MKLKVVAVILVLFSCFIKAEQLQFIAEDLPPYHYKDYTGQTKGAFVDIIHAIAQQAKIEYRIELYPFARAYKLLQNKPNVLMFSLLKSPGREEQFKWLGEIFYNTAYLVTLKGNKPKLENLEQAKNYKVGTIRSYYSHLYLKNAGFEEGKNLSLSVKYQHLWQMLFNKRIDYVLTNTLSLNNELTELGFKVEEVERTLELTDFPNQLHLVGNLSLSPSKAQALKQALKTIKANGEYQKILNQWGLD